MTFREDTLIHTLRARGIGAAPAARLRVANLLGGADLRPTGVSPSSVLIVRRMEDPMPGRLAPHRDAVRADASWERAMQDALAGWYRRAARPVQGRLPSDAEAVLFADEAEMLACFALDLSRGDAGRHWWWVALGRKYAGLSPSAQIARILREHAEAVPAILDILAAWRQAPAVIRLIEPSQALDVLRAVWVSAALPSYVFEIGVPEAVGARPRRQEALEERSVSKIERVAAPPWADYLASGIVPDDLTPEHACLLGVTLMVRRRSAYVRTPSFQQRLRRWWVQTIAPTSRPSGVPTSSVPVREERPDETTFVKAETVRGEEFLPKPEQRHFRGNNDDTRLRAGEVEIDRAALPEDSEDPAVHPAEAPHVSPIQKMQERSEGNRPAERAGGDSEDLLAANVVTEASDLARESDEITETGTDRPVPRTPDTKKRPEHVEEASDRPAKSPDVEEPAISFGEQYFDTRLGGLFFLVNGMRHLDLPGCFEPDWRLAGELGPWATLEVLGRAMISMRAGSPRGEVDDSLALDPVWRALALLDGRDPDVLPGIGYQGGTSFMMPAAWRDELCVPGASFHWAIRKDRLLLWRDDGIPVAELPRTSRSPRAQAIERLGTRASRVTRSSKAPEARMEGALVEKLNNDLRRWASLVVPFVRFRLGQALGVDPPDLAETLLLRSGRVYVTSSHVDVVLPLAAVSLPLRRSGLDVDPGWQPEFGRVILIHYDGPSLFLN